MNKLISYLKSLGYSGDVDAAKIEAFIATLNGANADEVMSMLSAAAGGSDAGADPSDTAALAVAAEEHRVDLMTRLGDALKVKPDVTLAAIREGDDVEAAKKRMRESLRGEITGSATRNLTVGDDRGLTAAREAMVDGVLLRAGVKLDKPHELARQFAGRPLLGMARSYLAAAGLGEAANSLSDAKLAAVMVSPNAMRDMIGGRGTERLSHSTSDFPNVMTDAMERGVLSMYRARSPSWTRWAKRGTASDYRAIHRVRLDFDALNLERKDADGGETRYGKITDRGETYQLADRAVVVEITRQAIVNDDLSLFETLPRTFVQISKGYEDRVAYEALAGAAKMSDNKPFFDAAHKNVVAGSQSGPPSVDTLSVMRATLAAQLINPDVAIDATAAHMVVPLALQTIAETLTMSPYVPNGTNATTNVFNGAYDVVASHLLSGTAWYLVADYETSGAAAVEVSFLQNEEEPVVTSETDFDTESRRVRVRHTVAAKALDYKAAVRNGGSGS